MTQTQALLSSAKEHMTKNYNPAPFILERGEGVWAWDQDGNKYLDFTSGIAVNSLGHGHPKVVEAIREQASRLSHVSNMFHHKGYIDMCQRLCDHSFGDHVFLCNSGAEAVEAAIKMARLYFHSKGENRPQMVATHGGFHGRTIGALSLTANPKYKVGFEPLMPDVAHVPFNDLEAARKAISSETAAFIVEPIQGNSGVAVADAGYLSELRKICDQTGTLLIVDEIQTAGGRTGKWFDHQHEDMVPDIMPLAKAIGGGMPLGALVMSKAVSEPLKIGGHGSTYGGNPVACAAGLATWDVVQEEGLMEHSVKLGAQFLEMLEGLKSKTELVHSVRGRGLMIGLELTCEARPVFEKARNAGLLVTLAGTHVLRILPPMIATESDCAHATSLLEQVLTP
jgi:acetylornithine/N-succinyldiaminopimelate aminotransferase